MPVRTIRPTLDIADGVNGSIKFIYKTDAVKED